MIDMFSGVSWMFPSLQLPSHRFQYSVWHDLREACLTGTQLKAPRVREGTKCNSVYLRSAYNCNTDFMESEAFPTKSV